MRTTITLEPDVAAAIEKVRREEGIGPSEAVNRLVRAGLAASSSKPRAEFHQRSAPLGLTVDVSNVGDVLDLLDER